MFRTDYTLYLLAEERVRGILEQVRHAELVRQLERQEKQTKHIRREAHSRSCRCTAKWTCTCCVPGQNICAA